MLSGSIIILIGIIAVMAPATMTFIVIHMVRGIHLQLNSRLDELLAATGAASHAAGVAEERDRPHEPEWQAKGN